MRGMGLCAQGGSATQEFSVQGSMESHHPGLTTHTPSPTGYRLPNTCSDPRRIPKEGEAREFSGDTTHRAIPPKAPRLHSHSF